MIFNNRSMATFILGVALFFNNVYSEESFSDFAVFKIQETVYFRSDLLEIEKGVRQFACAIPTSLLITSLNLAHFPDVKKIKFKNHKVDFDNVSPDRIITILKILQYISSQSISVSDPLLKHFKTLAKNNKCGEISSQLLPLVTKLFRGETYLTHRFKEDSFFVTKEDAEKLKEKYPDYEAAKVIKIEKEKRMSDSMKEFYSSIEKQISHEKLF